MYFTFTIPLTYIIQLVYVGFIKFPVLFIYAHAERVCPIYNAHENVRVKDVRVTALAMFEFSSEAYVIIW